MITTERTLFRQAYWLSLFTIGYNLIEGLVSTYLGYSDETLALFGFGADSFIEVISGLAVWQMVIRITGQLGLQRSEAESRSLRITGICFYLLTAGLLVGAVLNTILGKEPDNTLGGIVISLVSIAVMTWLVRQKMRVGTALHSAPIMADAKCTQVCVYMSVILLLSSLVFELTGFAYADAVGAVGLAYFSFREGKEALQKANHPQASCSDCGCH